MRVAVHIPMHRWEVTRDGAWTGLMENADWWAARAPVLRDITLNSLKHQTDKEFDVVISLREQDYHPDNPVVAVGDEAGVRWLVQPYMPWQYPVAPNQADAFCDWYGGARWLALMHLDSDDAYRRDAVAQVRAIEPAAGLMAWWAFGYLHEPASGRLAVYGSPKGPRPFWAEFYTKQALADPDAFRSYRARWGFERYHHQIGAAPNGRRLPEHGVFCQIIHEANAETAWANPNNAKNVRAEILDDAERRRILRQFSLAEGGR